MMDALSGLSWMAWTWPTAAFFLFILLCFIAMSLWEYYSPGGGPRHGILGLDTTRGDRLFISLITAAVIHLLWIGLVGTDVIATLPIGEEGFEVSSLWLATAISLGVAVLIFRTV